MVQNSETLKEIFYDICAVYLHRK